MGGRARPSPSSGLDDVRLRRGDCNRLRAGGRRGTAAVQLGDDDGSDHRKTILRRSRAQDHPVDAPHGPQEAGPHHLARPCRDRDDLCGAGEDHASHPHQRPVRLLRQVSGLRAVLQAGGIVLQPRPFGRARGGLLRRSAHARLLGQEGRRQVPPGMPPVRRPLHAPESPPPLPSVRRRLLRQLQQQPRGAPSARARVREARSRVRSVQQGRGEGKLLLHAPVHHPAPALRPVLQR
mmetsp:Transcript_17987/g.49902  ORF Transcript_17987/g.49902 Transcript_17987/m.49902 type:complete len:236 (+) Transcript_17987:387-1094(+)